MLQSKTSAGLTCETIAFRLVQHQAIIRLVGDIIVEAQRVLMNHRQPAYRNTLISMRRHNVQEHAPSAIKQIASMPVCKECLLKVFCASESRDLWLVGVEDCSCVWSALVHAAAKSRRSMGQPHSNEIASESSYWQWKDNKSHL